MKHRVTKRMEAIVEEVHVLRTSVETSLDLVSTAARDEWRRFLARLPAIADLESGFLLLSEAELEDAKAKIARFSALVRDGASGRAAPSIGPGRSPRRPS
jgi:hypothetical protein